MNLVTEKQIVVDAGQPICPLRGNTVTQCGIVLCDPHVGTEYSGPECCQGLSKEGLRNLRKEKSDAALLKL